MKMSHTAHTETILHVFIYGWKKTSWLFLANVKKRTVKQVLVKFFPKKNLDEGTDEKILGHIASVIDF